MTKRKRAPVGRMINGVVFSLSTPRRHGNSKSSNFMNEAGLTLQKLTAYDIGKQDFVRAGSLARNSYDPVTEPTEFKLWNKGYDKALKDAGGRIVGTISGNVIID